MNLVFVENSVPCPIYFTNIGTVIEQRDNSNNSTSDRQTVAESKPLNSELLLHTNTGLCSLIHAIQV